MAKTIIGIDLGTTNSCVSYRAPDGTRKIIDINGHRTMPSVVLIDGDDIVLFTYLHCLAVCRANSTPRKFIVRVSNSISTFFGSIDKTSLLKSPNSSLLFWLWFSSLESLLSDVLPPDFFVALGLQLLDNAVMHCFCRYVKGFVSSPLSGTSVASNTNNDNATELHTTGMYSGIVISSNALALIFFT